MIEFVTLIMFILAAFIVFQKYIVRGFTGRWKGVGDSFGQGKIYDPNRSIECAYDPIYTQLWYDRKCYEDNCLETCLELSPVVADCRACIQGCQGGSPDYCND